MANESEKLNLTFNLTKEKGMYVVNIEGVDRWGNYRKSTMYSNSLFSISRFIDMYIDAIQTEDGKLV